MTQTDTDQTNPTPASKVEQHRLEAMHFAECAEAYSDLITHEGNLDRGLNQRIGVVLKLADVHARLALAVSRSEGLDA